jgi:hypothetical protein
MVIEKYFKMIKLSYIFTQITQNGLKIEFKTIQGFGLPNLDVNRI